MRTILLIMIGLSSLVYADFIRSAEGIVTDTQTSLQWQDDYIDNDGSIKNANWTTAIEYCEALSLGGTEWRLPNKKELLSIVDYSTSDFSISPVFVNTASSYYWSSTSFAGGASRAWLVSFGNGQMDYYLKTDTYFVRCVRAGQ